MKAAPLRRRLWRVLGPRAAVLRCVAEEAAHAGVKAYLVGGPVRDLLLGRPISDLDVLLSSRLAQVARACAARLGGRATVRPSFLTATVAGAGFRLDLARARRERYGRPGALPSVESASVAEDLGRRDFASHALALPLDPSSGDLLLDPEDGLGDLERRRLRVLHAASFRDDPTRLLRAARYAARLGFRLEPATRRLAQRALEEGALDTISGDRVRHEIERLLDEERPERAAARTERMGLFDALCSGWHPAEQAGLRRLGRLAGDPPWPGALEPALRRACGLRLLLLGAPAPVRRRVLARLAVRGRTASALEADLQEFARLRRALGATLGDGRLDARLAEVGEPALLLAFCAGTPRVAHQVTRYASRLRHRRSPLDGHRARALGLRGSAIGALLRATRTRALDGAAVDDAWLRRWLARHG